MKYNVHLYPRIRVKVMDVEAKSQSQAIDRAEQGIDIHRMLRAIPKGVLVALGIEYAEYEDDLREAIVDEHDDPEFHNTRRHKLDISDQGGWEETAQFEEDGE